LGFFDRVPLEVWRDNPKTVAAPILKGRDRKLNPHYGALASHYRFAPMFRMPEKGQGKSDVERGVFAPERRFATPVPAVKDPDDLNRHPPDCRLKERDRVVRGGTESIGAMFRRETAQALESPAHPFDACLAHVRQVDKYQTVPFEDVRHGVPKPVAFETVTPKAYLNQIVIVHKGAVVARHPRGRTPGEQVLEPMRYPSVPGRKPAYLDKTRLFAEWKPPVTFARLRAALEAKHGPRTGARHHIRVLQLLASHSVETVESAIIACGHRQTPTAEIIAGKPNSLTLRPSPDSPSIASEGSPCGREGSPCGREDSPRTAHSIPIVHVPPPDLRRFDQLPHRPEDQSLQEGERDVRDVIEAQPQDAQAADDAGRTRAAVA